MYIPDPVLENEAHKILRDFEIQTGHLIPASQPEVVIVKMKKREPAKLWTLSSRRTTE